MKIILSRDIKNLGKVGDVVVVKDGYGRNFLLKKKYAVAATKSNMNNLEEKLSQLKLRNSELTDKAEQIVKLLENTVYNITRQAADDDTIYGSVRTKDVYNFIVDLLKNNNIDFNFDICGVKIAAPIKVLGRYVVDVEVFGNVAGKLRLNLCRVSADFDTDVAVFDQKMKEALLSVKDSKTKAENAEKVMRSELATAATKDGKDKQDSSEENKKKAAPAAKDKASSDNNDVTEVVNSVVKDGKSDEKKATKKSSGKKKADAAS